MELTSEEQRVLGCLVEKQLTTPQQYPLTLNALVLACNQTSNRDPVVHWDERTVEEAVTQAKARGLARFVHPSHGRSALRYRHELGDALGLDERQLALLAVLFLRGAQTPGELRSRTDRMARFADLAEVEAELAGLAGRENPPLVTRLGRRPGHKEDRYAHAFGPGQGAGGGDGLGEGGGGSPADGDATGTTTEVPVTTPGRPSVGTLAGDRDSADMSVELAQLRAEVAELRRDLDDLRAQLGA